MESICLTCGHRADIEAHHVAGERNHQSLTVPVCVPCHRVLSHWQLAAGIELHKLVDGTPEDSVRALIVGAMHLFQLLAERHPGRSWITVTTAIRASRAHSRLTDSVLPPDRAGRWFPDPTVPPLEVPGLEWPLANEAEWTREVASFALKLCDILEVHPPLAVGTMRAMIVDPVWWVQTLNDVGGDFSAESPLLRKLIDYTNAVQKFVLLVLNADLPEDLDERMADEIWNCVETSRRLMAELLDQVQERSGAPS